MDVITLWMVIGFIPLFKVIANDSYKPGTWIASNNEKFTGKHYG